MNLQIERIYDDLRRRMQKERDDRAAAIYHQVPELETIPERRRALVKDAALKRITAAEAREQLDALDREEGKLLADNGFSKDMLEVRFKCPLRHDTGWTGEAERRPCACRLKLMAETDPAMGINSRQTFERFSEDIFRQKGRKGRQEQRAYGASSMRIRFLRRRRKTFCSPAWQVWGKPISATRLLTALFLTA